jgi:hypothetical protein
MFQFRPRNHVLGPREDRDGAEKLRAGMASRVRRAGWEWLAVEGLWLIAQENPWHVVMRKGGAALPFCLVWAASKLRPAPTPLTAIRRTRAWLILLGDEDELGESHSASCASRTKERKKEGDESGGAT